jgi:hypothetical protein
VNISPCFLVPERNNEEKNLLTLQRRFILAIIIFSLMTITVACGLLDMGASACTDDDFWNSMTAGTLPPSAEVQREWCTSNFNPSYNVIFTISPSDLQAFQESTPVTTWETDAANAVSLEDEAARMDSLLFGGFRNGAIDLEILIDTSNPEKYTVYYQEVFVD